MLEKCISTIYERTCALIQSAFTNESEEALALYKSYLIDKYESQLSDIINSESEETLKAVVDVFIEDEIRIWTGLSESEMMSILEHDSAYEYLSFLFNIAFEQAKECYEKRKYYNNDEEYKLRLEEISVCLDKIKPYNLDTAKELLSETILDIDYIFGKSENTSLRLSHIV